jgi:hypothetical protein
MTLLGRILKVHMQVATPVLYHRTNWGLHCFCCLALGALAICILFK